MSAHGTRIRYTRDSCRCDVCTSAWTDYCRARREDSRALLSDVREWAYGLGFQLTGVAKKPLIARYNREHPERPFLTEANPRPISLAGWAE